MKFSIEISSACEVRFTDRTGEWIMEDKGEWKVDIVEVEKFINNRIESLKFGNKVTNFYFGFEIAQFENWGDLYLKTKDYIGNRPSLSGIVSVGQLHWLKVKDLTETDQFDLFVIQIINSIMRVGEFKRRPKDFDYRAFSLVIEGILKEYKLDVRSTHAEH